MKKHKQQSINITVPNSSTGPLNLGSTALPFDFDARFYGCLEPGFTLSAAVRPCSWQACQVDALMLIGRKLDLASLCGARLVCKHWSKFVALLSPVKLRPKRLTTTANKLTGKALDLTSIPRVFPSCQVLDMRAWRSGRATSTALATITPLLHSLNMLDLSITWKQPSSLADALLPFALPASALVLDPIVPLPLHRNLPEISLTIHAQADSSFDNLLSLQAVSPSLTALSLCHQDLAAQTGLTDTSILHIMMLAPALKSLSIMANNQITDYGASCIASMQMLTSLTLAAPCVTDSGLASLSSLSCLHTLQLANPHATSAGFARLVHLRQLQTAFFQLPGICDKGWQCMQALASLTRLTLRQASITDVGIGQLGCLIQLEALKLHGCPNITGWGLVYLAACTRLQYFECAHGCTSFSVDGISALATLKSLSQVVLSDLPQVPTSTYAFLSALPALRHLELAPPCKESGNAVMAAVACCASLQTLNLVVPDISYQGLGVLKRLPNLAKLHMLYASVAACSTVDRDVLPWPSSKDWHIYHQTYMGSHGSVSVIVLNRR